MEEQKCGETAGHPHHKRHNVELDQANGLIRTRKKISIVSKNVANHLHEILCNNWLYTLYKTGDVNSGTR